METSGTVQDIRREEGNLRYEYFLPMADPETVLLIDCWRDQEALDRHHASLMMERIAKLRENYQFQDFEPYDETSTVVRFVTSWATKEEAVHEFVKDFKKLYQNG